MGDGPMTPAFMAEVVQAAIERLCANGFQSCTHRLTEVRDQLRSLSPAAAGDGEPVFPLTTQPSERVSMTYAQYVALKLGQPQGVVGDETRDAARWRALVGSARVRVIGSAGLRTNIDPYGNPWDGYAHIGLELWTKHAPDAINEPPDAVEWLTKYADTAALHPPTREGQPDGR